MSSIATLTEADPKPRAQGAREAQVLSLVELSPLPPMIDTPSADFLEVLSQRRSTIGGTPALARLASLLWHSTQLRDRSFDGRFGQWESRPAPSAGGIHPIRLLVLPLEPRAVAGVYDDAGHALGRCGLDPAQAVSLNRASVISLTGARFGTTLQLFASPDRGAACYENYGTLLWRDAGALIATICFTAEALGLSAVPIGRLGTEIVRAFGLSDGFVGLGGVHVGSIETRSPSPS